MVIGDSRAGCICKVNWMDLQCDAGVFNLFCHRIAMIAIRIKHSDCQVPYRFTYSCNKATYLHKNMFVTHIMSDH